MISLSRLRGAIEMDRARAPKPIDPDPIDPLLAWDPATGDLPPLDYETTLARLERLASEDPMTEEHAGAVVVKLMGAWPQNFSRLQDDALQGWIQEVVAVLLAHPARDVKRMIDRKNPGRIQLRHKWAPGPKEISDYLSAIAGDRPARHNRIRLAMARHVAEMHPEVLEHPKFHLWLKTKNHRAIFEACGL